MDNEIYHIKKAKSDIREFDYLYRKYYPKINNFIYHRVADDGERQEIVSNVFYKAMKNLSRFTLLDVHRSTFSSWLYRIAINEMNQYYRDKKRLQKIKDNVAWNYVPKDSENEDKELKYENIIKQIKKLNQEEQDLITLRFFEKFSIKALRDCSIFHKAHV